MSSSTKTQNLSAKEIQSYFDNQLENIVLLQWLGKSDAITDSWHKLYLLEQSVPDAI